jgi:CRISPR-associated protein Csd1
MILQALNDLYERLADDASYELPRPGYSTQKVSFCVVLKPDGTLVDIQDARITRTKSTKAGKEKTTQLSRPVLVPGQSKPPGQGLTPCFLWDNSGYMLGYKSDDDKPTRTAEACEEFRKKHVALEKELNIPEFSAVCRFLESWKPKAKDALKYKAKLDDFAETGFGVFQIQGATNYIHEMPAIKEWWAKQQDAEKPDLIAQCLVTGRVLPIAQTHQPAIKGVAGAQSSGALLISFNMKAVDSYGRNDEQGYNAPVSQTAVFNYANALNTMLGGPQSHRHRVIIGDATTVFWTEKATEAESLFADFLQGNEPEEGEASQDHALATRLRMFMEILRQGGGAGITKLGDDPQTKFFILGLSPNASRLSVRFWHVATLGQMVDKLKAHYDALRLKRSSDKDPEFPAVWQILRQTGRESKDIPPLLSGSLMRSILTGSRYPQGLFNAVLNRIRADHDITFLRAAIFKAFLIRNHQLDIPMSLDTTRTEPAYLLGRLFAALEKTQEDALPGINATIRDRFYSAASATPGSVFPRLLRTYQHHLGKLDGGYKVNRERSVQQIMGSLNDMPGHLPLEGQGLFAIGYYHQRQDFFTKKDKTETPQA